VTTALTPHLTPQRLRRERTAAVLLALVAGLLGLLSASRTWAAADVTDVLAGQLRLRLSGRQVAPVVPAVSVVLLAAGAAVLLARRLGRGVAGLVLVLAGALCAAAAVSAARTPGAAVAAEVARATGRSAGPQVAVTTTAWPWLAVAAGVLAVVAGALVVVGARRWSAPSQRFEVPAAASAEGASVSDMSAGGTSPSDAAVGAGAQRVPSGPSLPSGAAGAAPAVDRPTTPSEPRTSTPLGPEPADAWDALSRGEDPTR
jgi:uncharacterized membrane protein (TIGR02234 family)